jgi:hypothetical protein
VPYTRAIPATGWLSYFTRVAPALRKPGVVLTWGPLRAGRPHHIIGPEAGDQSRRIASALFDLYRIRADKIVGSNTFTR